jgi:hypothetical protein
MPQNDDVDNVEVNVAVQAFRFRWIFTAPPFYFETERFFVSVYFMNDFVVLLIQDEYSAVHLRTDYQVVLRRN